jgi:hypothetical protein
VRAVEAAANQRASSACSKWISKTNARMTKQSERRWRGTIVDAMGDESCPAVPEALRDAARAVRRIHDERRRDRVLADAATRVLGAPCAVAEPANDSRALARACPLPAREEFSGIDDALRDIRAVDYVLINALASSLIASDVYDTDARRLMLNFMLSASLLGEKPRP